MKKNITSLFLAKNVALCLLFGAPMVATGQVIFTQNFNASTTLTDYFNAVPTANQFDYIGEVGSGNSSVSATGNRLNLQRDGNNVAFARTTDFSPTPSVLKIKFKLSVPFSNNMTATPSAGVFYVGSGFTPDGIADVAANRHSSLLIGFAATSGTFNLRTAAFVTSSNYTGEQIITWYINNSGASVNYTDPAAGSTALADDKMDVWVGTTRIFNNVAAVTSGQSLTDFKFLFSNSASNSHIAIDDIVISKDAAALPVSLSKFTANKADAANQLTWVTAAEQNASHFTVERSSNGQNFEAIGKVSAQGKAATYGFTDDNPLDISYYRLRQADLDGAEALSNIVSVTQAAKGRINITPNPTYDRISINLSENDLSDTDAKVALFDMTGRQVLTQNVTSDVLQLDLSNLVKGMYILTVVQANRAVYQEKIIRQ